MGTTEKVYDLTSAARKLGLSRRTLRRAVDSGTLKAETVGALTGQRYTVTEEDLEAFERARNAGDSA